MGCLATLQTVTLAFIEKSDVPELVVWTMIFLPCLLAVLGTFRLLNLLCKKQISHLCLMCGVLLVEPKASALDLFLYVGLAAYTLAALLCVGITSWQASTAVVHSKATSWVADKELFKVTKIRKPNHLFIAC